MDEYFDRNKTTITLIQDLNNIDQYTTFKRLKKAVDSGKAKVKRAPSPYIVFCTEMRPIVKEKNPEATFGMMGKLMGTMWGKILTFIVFFYSLVQLIYPILFNPCFYYKI